MNKQQILKVYIHDTVGTCERWYPKDTMHEVEVAVEQIYPGSACGKGDAFNGNKYCE